MINEKSCCVSARVSIVIPAYNSECSLPDTLASLECQTVRDWEAIVVDDGSSDGTPAIIQAAAVRDPRIVGETGSHGGASAARNRGLQRACAEWILFLDSDDTLPPDHLEVMLAAAADHPQAAILHTGWRRYSADGVLLGSSPAEALPDAFAITAWRCPFAIHAALTRRDAIAQIGGFDESILIGEDWDLWQRLARSGALFAAVPARWVNYNQRAGSLSTDHSTLMEQGLLSIDRGFAADPRVQVPDPRYAQGASPSDRAEARALFALWTVGNILGQGGDPEGSLALVPDLQLYGVVDSHRAAIHLIDGMTVGARRPLAEWNQIWAYAEPGFWSLIVLLDTLNPATRDGGWLRYAVEQHVSASLDHLDHFSVGALQVITIDVGRVIDARQLGATTDRLRCRIVHAGERVGDFETLGLGFVPAESLSGHILCVLDWKALARRVAETSLRTKWRWLRWRLLQRWPVVQAKIDPWHPLRLCTIDRPDPLAAAIDAVAGDCNAVPTQRAASREWPSHDYASVDFWESVFATPDPWEYDNSYETVKYRQTLASVAEGKIAERALEVACAEGHFTPLLASKVGDLLATDISPTAVERTAARCAELRNVRCATLDLTRDDLPGRFDLIVCSEVLYYLPDKAALEACAAKMADALNDGGRLIVTHANLLVDEPDRSGFPWAHDYGAKGIGSIIGTHPALRLEHETWTPLYRVQ